jgi:mannitol/fructose-specific phosphotransferase system IIA component
MKELKAKMELGWTVLENVNKRALELQDVTLQLKERCIQGLEQLADIMIGFDAQNTEHLKIFQQTAILIKSMSELAQVPVMDEEGNVSEMSGIVKGNVLSVLNNQLH